MTKLIDLYNRTFVYLYKFTDDIFKLFLRLYVADVFFRAGLTKLGSWDSELPFLSSGAQYLFESEYSVPLIPWELAAYLGTAAELFLPILLLLGLATRLSALALFAFNIVAVVSYPILWEGGFYDHKLWGAMLLVVVIYGQGKISLDNIICRRVSK
ncbi:DoxX family protein [Bathymodiolus septemdierum thioautotrophic gill symbiont]|uniref:Oxidoreductase n=1 Tax=endosymbiont of Bathymodiolus septemdierum str. Myojin knoll TaxID=1303921 RepID=A0A0P0UQX7_9GAMM|nr:DoxX family protein [Bathymodiolus septemdierum thioautotrophic gill symbiont]BAS67490.1 oxidoreductase [endosymbiont of Bathymodiolus septemdierum str. Myojin knoll]